MAFPEIMQAVAEMSEEERRLLRERIDELPDNRTQLNARDRTRRLNAALDQLGAGLSKAQLDEMTAAMTEDHIANWDDTEWTQ